MREGLYKVEFKTPLGTGAGLMVLVGGRLWGGDPMIAYVGTYVLSGDQFTAEVRTYKHSIVPGMSPVFGRDDVHLSLRGTSSGDTAQMTGTAREAPGLGFLARMMKLPD